jgi:hypothetical protein
MDIFLSWSRERFDYFCHYGTADHRLDNLKESYLEEFKLPALTSNPAVRFAIRSRAKVVGISIAASKFEALTLLRLRIVKVFVGSAGSTLHARIGLKRAGVR